ncbi:MAG: hypothetical protein CM1200mP18_17580 [Gammaproteobacteria bacterium]|nr:MAG: hypothetical protein CM1200mP18_17580 [Gammaproteobacteria bacterium]
MFGPYEQPDRLEHFAREMYPIGSVQTYCLRTWMLSRRTGPPHQTGTILGEVGIQSNVRGPIGYPRQPPLCGPPGEKQLMAR